MNSNSLINKMVKISLVINILILMPVCYILFFNNPNALDVFGEFTPARGVLLSMYLSILILSFVFLFKRDLKFVSALLLVQVVYKITTPFTIGEIYNPLVVANLFVVAVHLVTLFLIYKNNK